MLTEGIPFFDSLDVDWSVDPIKNVATVEVEQYWALAEKDSEAPIEKTLKRLQQLQQQGKDIRIRIFPDSDHGMWSIGESKIVDGYFDSLADFAKGKLKASYGDSWEITVSK